MTDENVSDPASSIVRTGSSMPFVVFAGANAAANHLLELVRVTTSPSALQAPGDPALEAPGDQARYVLPVPVWTMEKDSSITKWMIGSGAPPSSAEDGLTAAQPDILLCPPGASASASSARQDIHPLHAVLYFHPRSGGLVFENRSGNLIVYEGGGKDGQDLVLTKYTTMQTLLWKRENYLQFGEHRFLISFVSQSTDDQVYIGQQFDNIIGCLYGSLAPSTLFNFTPGPDAHLNWHIAVHKLFPKKRLAAGIDVRTGQPLVVEKVSKKDSMARQYIVTRLQAIYRTDIGPQEGIMKALDVWCNVGRLCHNLRHERGGPCHCEYIEYSMPVAEHSFQDMPWDEVTANDRIHYFRQTLVGLAKLHDMGIRHGNISPTSLLLLTEEGCEMPDSDRYSVKKLKAVLSVCMQPTKTAKQSLCIAPELLAGLFFRYWDLITPDESGAQGTGENEAVAAAVPNDANSLSLGESDDQAMESFCASLNDATASIPELPSNDTAELAQRILNDADAMLGDVSGGNGWQLVDDMQYLDGKEADVWALAMSWLSTLIALPSETIITRDIHSRLLDDLDAQINSSGTTNEKIMALIIRDMLCWDPQARPRAEDALQHPAWSVIMMRLANEEDKKRKRGGISRQGSQSELREDKRARVISLDE
jgi:serine/threonine protein kinase